MILMFSPLDQLWACCNVMGLFSPVPLHGGNTHRGLDLDVAAQVDVVQGRGPAKVKRLC